MVTYEGKTKRDGLFAALVLGVVRFQFPPREWYEVFHPEDRS